MPGRETQIATKFWCPAAIAVQAAVRSAQMVSPYEAFSTLHPATMSPDAVSRAAPTWNRE